MDERSLGSVHAQCGNLMWNHRDEEWFRRRSDECITTTGQCAQPIFQSSWKKYFPNKKFDLPFEGYCQSFLNLLLSSKN